MIIETALRKWVSIKPHGFWKQRWRQGEKEGEGGRSLIKPLRSEIDILRLIAGSEALVLSLSIRSRWMVAMRMIRHTMGFNGLITHKPCSSVVWTSGCAWHQSPQRSGRALSVYLPSIPTSLEALGHRCVENCNGRTRRVWCSTTINKIEWTWLVNYYTSPRDRHMDVIHPGINLDPFRADRKYWVSGTRPRRF